MSYNGWTNKETWLVNLWLGDMLQADLEYGQEIDASYVETLVDEMASDALEDGANGFITDLLNCAIGEINYHEIASHYEIEES
jgi:hypothetical protein